MLWNAWYFLTSFYHWLLDCCKYCNCLITWLFNYSLGLPVMYCLLEVVSVYPEKLATRFVDKMDWIKVCCKPFFWFIFWGGGGLALAKSGIFPWWSGVSFPSMHLIWNLVFLLTVSTSWDVTFSRVGKIIIWCFNLQSTPHEMFYVVGWGKLFFRSLVFLILFIDLRVLGSLCHWSCRYSQFFPLIWRSIKQQKKTENEILQFFLGNCLTMGMFQWKDVSDFSENEMD